MGSGEGDELMALLFRLRSGAELALVFGLWSDSDDVAY